MLNPEIYLYDVDIPQHRIALSRFKILTHNLEIEVGRRTNTDPELRLCKFSCTLGTNVVEDEYHFLLIWPMYSNIRDDNLTEYIVQSPTSQKFVSLMQETNVTVVKKLAKYCYEAVKIRNSE